MAHHDTNDDEQYDFVDSEGADDGPYVTDEGDPVMNAATLASDDGQDAEMSGGDGAGFGVVPALLAVLGSLFVSRRKD